MNAPAIKCLRLGCDNNVEQSRRGRRQRFCSDRCRKGAARSRVRCPEIAPKAPTADDPRQTNFRTKLSNKINGLQGQKTPIDKASLRWVKVNDVTWKLTDGERSLTPASHGQWGGYYTERAVAWLMEVGWPFGKTTWYARCGDKSFGPTTFAKAKEAARALITGAPLPQDANAHAFVGPIDLNAAPPEAEAAAAE
jgi:hypothetical protein